MARRMDAGEQANERRESQGCGGAWTTALAAGGLVALAGGGLLAAAPRVNAELSWVAVRLAETGVSSGAVIACGVICLGLGAIAHGVAQLRRQTREFGNAARDIRGLYHDVNRVEDRLGRLGMEISALQEANKTLLKAAQEQVEIQSAGQQIDATYRLAASLDQLGARVESRLNEQQSDFRAAIGQITGTVTETREQLETWLEHYEARPCDSSLEELEELDDFGNFDDVEEFEDFGELDDFGDFEDLEDFEDLAELEFELLEQPVQLEGPPAPDRESGLDIDARPELPELDDETEFEVLVTLEDLDPEVADEDELVFELEEDSLGEASRHEEAVRTEDAERDPPANGEPEVGLGLLDVLDDHGSPREKEGPPPEPPLAESKPPSGESVENDASTPTPEPPPIFATLEKPSPPARKRDHEDEVEDEELAELLSDEALQEALEKLKHRDDL